MRKEIGAGPNALVLLELEGHGLDADLVAALAEELDRAVEPADRLTDAFVDLPEEDLAPDEPVQ
jgi:hypothetical protein